jgi:hypothetical protein
MFAPPRRAVLVSLRRLLSQGAAKASFATLSRAGARPLPLSSLHLHHRVVAASKAPPANTAPPPPLVLLHGLFGSSSNFGSLAKRLASTRQVLVPDLRNHGASPWHEDCSIEAMAQDVLRLLDAAGAERGVLCGHSLGGKVAWPGPTSRVTHTSDEG